jgi:hypothetical protein
MTRHTASLVITGHDLDFRNLAKAATGQLPVAVASDAYLAIAAARQALIAELQSGDLLDRALTEAQETVDLGLEK